LLAIGHNWVGSWFFLHGIIFAVKNTANAGVIDISSINLYVALAKNV
jgi:hypothetical protein